MVEHNTFMKRLDDAAAPVMKSKKVMDIILNGVTALGISKDVLRGIIRAQAEEIERLRRAPKTEKGTSLDPVFLRPRTSRDFKAALKASSVDQLQIAEVNLVALRDIGEKVSQQLESVEHELKLRHAAAKKETKKAARAAV